MAIYCEDLFKLSSFRDARLRGGRTGLGRKITWPYVGATPSVSQWLHGGELLFLTGVGIPSDDESLLNLVDECIQKNLSGIVFLLNPQYIPEIPEAVIEKADQEGLPVFQMPWDVKLIDATREIIELMEQVKEKSKNVRFFLESLLFSNNSDIDSITHFYNIRPHSQYCICVVESADNVFSEAIESNFQHLSASVRNIALSSRLAILSCSYANRLIFLLTADSKSDTVYLQNTISNNFEYIQALHASRGGFMKMAFSRTFTKLNQIKQCYHEITVALSTKNLHALFPNHIIHYENLGIYRILFELDKNESIRDYCMKNIDPLISYDAQNSSSLLETLRLYFINNCHSSQTAQALFIHKNTLVYRLSLIKELLHTDLSNALKNLELFNSILLYDYLHAV